MPDYFLFVLLISIVIIFFIAFLMKRKKNTKVFNIKDKWLEVEGLMKSDSSLSWKMAIIEADKLMDSALKTAKMRGTTMGERLRFAVYKHPKIRSVWSAHILRNDLVHETDRRMGRKEAQRALILFKKGLKILGAL